MPLPLDPIAAARRRIESSSASQIAIKARWFLPVSSPPLENSLLTIERGRIVELGRSTSAAEMVDLGECVVFPALINAHVHYELSQFSQPLGTFRQPFPDWIFEIVSHRRDEFSRLGKETIQLGRQAACEQGLHEAGESGTAWAGDIVSPGWPEREYRKAAVGGVAFLELIGLGSEKIEPLVQQATAFLDEHGRPSSLAACSNPLNWQPGISPHAPYTVHPDLLQRLCRLSAERQVPLAMHLAESPEEIELLANHSGRFVEVLKALGSWQADAIPRGIRPLEYLHWLGETSRALVVHGNYLSTVEIEFLARANDRMTLVYCPRTHAYFHSGDHPWRLALERHASVAIGTDSRASNPDLSLWEELRFLNNRYPDVSDQQLLQLGTLFGAQALGQENDLGSLEVGKRASLLAIPAAAVANGLFSQSVPQWLVRA